MYLLIYKFVTDWCEGLKDNSTRYNVGDIVDNEQGMLLKCDLEPDTFTPIWINVTEQKSNISQPTLSQALDNTTTSTTHSLSTVSTSTQTTSTLLSSTVSTYSSPQQSRGLNETATVNMQTSKSHQQTSTNRLYHIYDTTTHNNDNSQIIISTVTPISLVTVCLTICAIVWCNQRRTVNQPPNAAPSATETADISEEEEAENEYDTISGDYHHYDDVQLNTVSTAMQPESGAGPSHNHIKNGEDDHNHDDSDNRDVGADLTVNTEDNYVLDAETAYMTRL